MKITRTQLETMIREELNVLKEDWTQELYKAMYALEDNVEGVVVGTELEQPYNEFYKKLKAHIEQEGAGRMQQQKARFDDPQQTDVDPLEEVAKSTDLDAARDARRPRDPIGRVEAIKLLGKLEDMGYVSSRGAVGQMIDLLQALENSGDVRHGGWD